MNSPKVSIIIPVYNGHKYISKCLDSVLSQSYTNIEVIVVNDGSTDNTLDILNKYKQKDNRLVVLSGDNHGQSFARNTGLSHSTGEYITFIDSDDTYNNRHIELLVAKALSTNSEVVATGRRELFNDNEVIHSNNLYKDKTIRGVDALCSMLRYKDNVSVMVWDKLYKKDVLPDKYFDPPYHRYSEDSLFNFKVLLNTNRFSYVDYVGYNYDHRGSIITSSGYNKDRMNNIDAVLRMHEYLNDNKDNLSIDDYQDIYMNLISFQFTLYSQCFRNILLDGDYKNKDKDDYKRMVDISKKIDTCLIDIDIKHKIQWFMYLYTPSLYILSRRINHLGDK